MKISVTQKHIDESRKILSKNGGVWRTRNCPIALAIKEAFSGECATVCVPANCATVFGGEENKEKVIGFFPAEHPYIRVFINRFDLGRDVAPFEFELEIPYKNETL